MPYTHPISYVHKKDHNSLCLDTKLSYQYIYKKAFDVVMKL